MNVLNSVSLSLLWRYWLGQCRVPDNILQEKIPIFGIFPDLYHRFDIILLFSILEVYSQDGIFIYSYTSVFHRNVFDVSFAD